MGNDMSKEDSKAVGGTVGGATTAVSTGAGIALMFLGPIGMMAGGVLLGAGISSGVNTVQQCTKDEPFSYGKWGTGVGIGALGGAIAAPLSVAGGLAAAGISGAAAKVGTVIAAETIGGAMAGGVTTVASKAANGENVTTSDFGKGVLIGGLTGLVGGGCGQATGKLASTVGTKTIGNIGSAGRTGVQMAVRTVGGGAGGAGTAALATFVENAINRGEFKRESFMKAMKSYDASTEAAEKLWAELCNRGIVVDEKVKEPLPDNVHFPEELECYRDFVKKLIEEALDLGKGVGDAAAQGAIVGGVSGLISGGVDNKKQRMKVKSDAKIRAEQVKNGAQAGSIEAEAYARQNNRKVVIHHDDGSTTEHGSKSAEAKVHVKYNSQEQHYSPADANGKALPVASENRQAGNCFFEAVAPGENPDTTRQEVSKFMSEKPLNLKGTGLKELHHGGNHLGGGSDRGRLPKSEYEKALSDINQEITDPEVRRELRESARDGLKKLQGMKDSSFKELMFNCDEKKSRYRIHALTGELDGYVAVDVYDSMHDQGNRGVYRLVFQRNRNELQFNKFLSNHNYKQIKHP